MAVNSVWISTDLVLSNTKYGDDERILIMTGDSVDLIEAVADVAAQVDVYDSNFSTLKRLRNYMRKENVVFFDDVYPTETGLYNTAIVFVPKGRQFARAQIWSAMQSLKEGGDLFIVGPNKGGAKSLIKDAAQAFGDCQVLDYKKSHRVAVTRKEQSAYDYPADWGAIPTESHNFSITSSFGDLEIVSQAGVYSWKALDDGTAYLLGDLVLRDANSVLDVGCGYGVIGASLANHVEHITLTDSNLLAVKSAKATIEHNQISNATVIASDIYSELGDQQFDLIVSNPPFHQGFEISTNVTHKLIQRAPDYLTQGGRLVIVANEFLKYEEVFGEAGFKDVNTRAKNAKFKIIEGMM